MSETTEHPTLSEFLLARIAEDEAAARACLDVNQQAAMLTGTGPRRWVSDGASIRDSAERFIDQTVRVVHTWAREAEHITRWDPARVLAECEAKRRIVASFAASSEPLTARSAEMAVVRMVLKLLALPYADHADYREEWRS